MYKTLSFWSFILMQLWSEIKKMDIQNLKNIFAVFFKYNNYFGINHLVRVILSQEHNMTRSVQ